MEKNLLTFETISEWADIIAFLSRLTKTLSAYPQFPVIPKRLIVCKRLAQCLNPNLPSGVHQKTLEAYVTIFQKIGIEGLQREPLLYGFGIFPFFECASSLIKHEVLDIVNRFYIPLGSCLKDCLQPLIFGLLSGLEEESGEHFDKLYKIFESVANATGRPFFIEKMWTALLVSPKNRLSAINYFSKAFSKKLTEEEAENFLIGKSDLVISSLSTALEDQQALVIRGVLDIINANFPPDCSWLSTGEKILLAKSVISVLAKRDMSLTRRVYTWILSDSNESTEANEVTPSQLTSNLLLMAVKSMLMPDISKPLEDTVKPLKILLFLNDKPDILDPVFRPLAMDLISFPQLLLSLKHPYADKCLSAAIQLFGVVEISRIWQSITASIIGARGQRLCDDCSTMIFGVTKLSICEEEASYLWLPLLSNLLLIEMAKYDDLTVDELIAALRLSAATLNRWSLFDEQLATEPFSASVATKIMSSFPSVPALIPEPVDSLVFLLQMSFRLATNSLLKDGGLNEPSKLLVGISNVVREFFTITNGNPHIFKRIITLSETAQLVTAVHTAFSKTVDLLALESGIHLLLILQDLSSIAGFNNDIYLSPVISLILDRLFDSLSVSSSQNLMISQLFCDLYLIFPLEIDKFFSKKISAEDTLSRASAILKVTNVWTIVVGLPIPPSSFIPNSITIMLQYLRDSDSEIMQPVYNWLSKSISYLSRLLEPFLSILIDVLSIISEPSMTFVPFYSKLFNADQVFFCLDQLNFIINLGGQTVTFALNQTLLDLELSKAMLSIVPPRYLLSQSPENLTVLNSLLIPSLALSCAECLDDASPKFRKKIELIQSAAQNLLITLVKRVDIASRTDFSLIYEILLDKLQYNIQISSFAGQALTLKALECTNLAITKYKSTSLGKQAIDCMGISKVASQVLKHAEDFETINAWIEFLGVSFSFYDDALAKLIEPQCRTLIQRAQHICSEMKSDITLPISESSKLLFTVLMALSSLISLSISGDLSLFESSSLYFLRYLCLSNKSGSGDQVLSANDLRINTVSCLIPDFLVITGAILGQFNSRDLQLETAISIVYRTNPITVLYTITSHLASQLEATSDTIFLPQSAISSLFSWDGPLGFDLIKNLGALYKSIRDSKNDPFGKLSLEAFLLVSFFVVERTTQESHALEILDFLSGIIKDLVSNITRFKSVIYILLTNMVILFKGPLSHLQTTSEFIKSHREALDSYGKLLDSAVSQAVKCNDPNMWTPVEDIVEKLGQESLTFDFLSAYARDKVTCKILIVLLLIVLPDLERAIGDVDRLQPFLGSLLSQVVIPNLKLMNRSHLLGLLTFQSLIKLTLQKDLCKYWKKEFWEYVFLDSQFFSCGIECIKAFLSHMKIFLSLEPDKIPEILARIPSSGSSNLFLSKEMEIMNRAIMIRRLSFVIFCVELEILRSNMPQIQEKIVDILKMGAGICSAEIFFLLRLLISRFGNEMPTTLWPVIVTEIITLFKSLLKSSDQNINYSTLLTTCQACRLIDLVILYGYTTPILYIWCLFDSKISDNSKYLFSKIAAHYQLSPSQKMDDGANKRLPLVKGGEITSIQQLSDFFLFSPERLRDPNFYKLQIDKSVIGENILLDFGQIIKTNE